MTTRFKQQLDAYRTRVNEAIQHALTSRFEPKCNAGPLYEAMRYALTAGGKRLRPALVLSGCELLGGTVAQAMHAAVAIEFIHTYSLIHDDLPAMDDATLRRGKPALHVEFGEGIAVLAGDALLTEAFALLADPPQTVDCGRALKVLSLFGDVAGVRGMVRGQELDLINENKAVDLDTLKEIHRYKTAAMLRGALCGGAILGGADDAVCARLAEFGQKIGLAFQIRDDLLDVTGDSEALGKATGQDAQNQKATYPALLGVDESRSQMLALLEEAREILIPFGERAAFLNDLTVLIGERRT